MEPTSPPPAAVAIPAPDPEAVLAELERLSRNHLLYFRTEVGRVLSESFAADDLAAYREGAGKKEGSFRQFVVANAARLSDLGLNETLLRQSLLCWFVVRQLPSAVTRKLGFTQVLELTRVSDDQTRRILAEATVENGWPGSVLRDAVLAVRAGRWIDGDPGAPGLQPPPEPPEPADPVEKPVAAGRVVTRFEKTADDLDDLVSQWERVSIPNLTELQATRMRDAVGRLKARVAALEAKLVPKRRSQSRS